MATVDEEQRTATAAWPLNGNGNGALVPADAGGAVLPPDPDDEFEDQPMTLTEHLRELRNRLIRMVIGIVIGMIGGFFLAPYVVDYFGDVIKRGDPNAVLAQRDPTEYVVTYLKITFYLGIALAMPILVYQLIRFLAPGLTRRERRYVYGTLPFIILCFVGGVLFASLVAIPNMFKFLLEVSAGKVENLLGIEAVLSFFASLSLWTGVFFEMPVIMFVLASLNIVTFQTLRRTRRYASVGLMIVAAIITPTPDALSMIIVWAPMYVLYEVGLILAWFASRMRRNRPAAVTPAE
jgi:sec-independent protein translocase protein TatC